ncbi:MAG: DUF4136 domain-containing protein [Gammaproteobacteria bacterium]|nr:DUF4136 domain-containing protein [Gammaproteobacteria bacterium]NNJ51302.1 DUF4136 domain-containing protein [Gammaproteobacteria bacterium]
MFPRLNTVTKRVSGSAIVLIFLQGCSGITVSQDYEQEYNFAGLKTFAWKPGDDNGYGVAGNDLLDKRIRTAIENNLLAKSYRKVDSYTPDFFVSYHYDVAQKIKSSGLSGGIAIGRSSYGGFGGVGMSTGSDVRAYDQGALLIDVTVPLEDKLIWRGTARQPVSDHSSPEESTAKINETVEKTLAQFPPR